MPGASQTIAEYAPPALEESAGESTQAAEPSVEVTGVQMPWEEPGAAATQAPAADAGAEEGLPWLAIEEGGEEAPAAAEAPQPEAAASAPAEEEFPAWLSWADEQEEAAPSSPVVEYSAPEAPAEEPVAPAAAAFASEELAAGESEVMEPWAEQAATEPEAAEPEAAVSWEPEADRETALEATPDMEGYFAASEAAAVEDAYSEPVREYGEEEREEEPTEEMAAAAHPVGGAHEGAFAEVADRLERIARALRENPSEVMSGGEERDPLELLVTGFVLGYAQGRNRGA